MNPKVLLLLVSCQLSSVYSNTTDPCSTFPECYQCLAVPDCYGHWGNRFACRSEHKLHNKSIPIENASCCPEDPRYNEDLCGYDKFNEQKVFTSGLGRLFLFISVVFILIVGISSVIYMNEKKRACAVQEAPNNNPLNNRALPIPPVLNSYISSEHDVVHVSNELTRSQSVPAVSLMDLVIKELSVAAVISWNRRHSELVDHRLEQSTVSNIKDM